MRSSKRKPTDINKLAASIVDQATHQPTESSPQKEKNPAAVALGRLGGLKGGKARSEKLSSRRKKEIARQAAIARWAKQKQT